MYNLYHAPKLKARIFRTVGFAALSMAIDPNATNKLYVAAGMYLPS